MFQVLREVFIFVKLSIFNAYMVPKQFGNFKKAKQLYNQYQNVSMSILKLKKTLTDSEKFFKLVIGNWKLIIRKLYFFLYWEKYVCYNKSYLIIKFKKQISKTNKTSIQIAVKKQPLVAQINSSCYIFSRLINFSSPEEDWK